MKKLRELALKVFSENALKIPNFMDIKTFEDAIKVLGIDISDANTTFCSIKKISRSCAAMFKLDIVRKALNLEQSLYLTKNNKNSTIYYPYNQFITKTSVYYKNELNSGEVEIIGKIKNEGEEFYVLGGNAINNGYDELGCYYSYSGIGIADAYIGFFGCANKKIAEHFGKYFGMLITEAKFGYLDDFEIINDKYGNS